MRQKDFDAIVVGAGFSGIYQLYKLRQLGLSCEVIDHASDVGGTWYWNKYPESFVYRFSWDKEDLEKYPWSEHYVKQPDVLRYLNHVTDKYDLRKHMRFNTALESADWDESRKVWRIGVSGGEVLTARYLITALGLLSRQNYPDIKGIDTFHGEMTHSAKWPKGFTVDNKRVGIIGSGSTGIQIMTDIAKKVKSLTSFQRHPQYTVPSGDGPVSPEYRQWVNENYDQIFERVRHSMFGFGIEESKRPLADAASEVERDAIFQDAWDKGNGFRFMFGTFCDITTNPEANEAACEFIRKKIGEIVKDPVKAKKLQPRDIYARRPLCDGGYFEQFNRPNVDIVDLREVDIEEITPKGIKTSDGVEHELDVLIFATGFDAVDGNYTRLKIHGRDGQTLKDRWEKHGPRSFLGMFNPGFPSFINLAGPKGPFANFPPILEAQIEFVTTCIDVAEKNKQVVEATEEADQQWSDYCDNLAKGSLFWNGTDNWIFGANIPGKKKQLLFFFGGIEGYRKRCDDVVDGGFKELGTLVAAAS